MNWWITHDKDQWGNDYQWKTVKTKKVIIWFNELKDRWKLEKQQELVIILIKKYCLKCFWRNFIRSKKIAYNTLTVWTQLVYIFCIKKNRKYSKILSDYLWVARLWCYPRAPIPFLLCFISQDLYNRGDKHVLWSQRDLRFILDPSDTKGKVKLLKL